MYKPDLDTKYKIARELFDGYDDIDPRYYGYSNSESLPTSIAHLIDVNKNFVSEDELREHIKRCLEVDHNRVVGSQYFSVFSLECIQIYRDGYFRACVILAQSVCEGLIRFVANRNQIVLRKREKASSILKKLSSKKLGSKKLLTAEAKQAALEIIKESDRNDLHHMNADIAKIEDWHQHAKQHLRNLATIEHWVFGYDTKQGVLYPHYPQHWDSDDGGNTIIGDLRASVY